MQVSDREFKKVAKQVGHRIQQLRKTAGMTQAELEAKTGLSDVGVHERGEKNPTLLTLLRFSKNLRVTLKDLFDIAEKESEEEKNQGRYHGVAGTA